MPTAADDRDPLDVIAEEFAERCRRGETPSVSEYAALHPHLANDLNDLLPAVAQMESLKKIRRPKELSPAPERPRQVPGYRIVREIGRGGMGVVYEAEDEQLHRRVALKFLPADARADKAKAGRFLREAQAMARLNHPHIVPVFRIAEHDGTPFYAMQFIPGCGLNDVLAGWRSPAKAGVLKPRDWRAIAAIVRAAATALQAAHEAGVLHRDVKPGNLLLDPRGHVWVTDFGLAKVQNELTLTATGEVMGTLAYMAPEAFRGLADERTDVYGLGMTLYQLITRRLPFDESNPAVLLKEIETADPTPPRRLDPDVPRDLETIVLKAIAREPERRYATAGDFADDLDAYLHDIPIRARRGGAAFRGWRWCKRNPAVATLSATLALLVGGAAGFGWVMYAEAKTALAVEAQLRRDAEYANGELLASRHDVEAANRKLAENLKRSLATLERVLDAAGKPPMRPDGPRPGPPDMGVLEAILSFYETYAEQNATDPKLRHDAARAYRRVGEVHFNIDRSAKGEAAMLRSVELFAGLLAELPEGVQLRREYVLSAARLPVLRADAPGYAARLAIFARAAGYAHEFPRPRPGEMPPMVPTAAIQEKLIAMLRDAGRHDEADRVRRR